jgi:hypothetical protein
MITFIAFPAALPSSALPVSKKTEKALPAIF